MRRIFALLFLLCAPALFAQTMMVHRTDDTLRLNLAELDSIQFGEESALLPLQVDLSVNRIGEVASEGIWRIELAASLFDAAGAPLLDGIPVRFEVDADDTLVTTEYGTTGSPSADGITASGVAYGGLLYPSRATNDTVLVSAVCDYAGEVFSAVRELRLPGQQLTAVLYVSPENYHLSWPLSGYIAVSAMVIVQDGFGNPVPDEEVLYNPQQGRMYEHQILLPDRLPAYHETTDEDGYARRWWIILLSEAFPDPSASTSTSTLAATLSWHPNVNIESRIVTIYH
ncbi:hypothetical protein KQI63_11765 [bacterium]|nr:hypothetical protein [bacterium]